MPEHWGFKKQEKPPEPAGPFGGKKRPRYPIFRGTKKQWEESLQTDRYRRRVLFEIFPDPEHQDKWVNLDPPDRKIAGHKKNPGFWRALIWYSRCLPLLKRLKTIFPGRLDEPIPVQEIVDTYQSHFKKYKRNYIIGTLNQLWKGGQIRKFVRHNRFMMKKDGSRIKNYSGGIHYGVHYQIEPWLEENGNTTIDRSPI